MRLLILYIALLKVVQANDLTAVSGYVGQTVTLPSGADASWNFESITWSIYTNSTWIATYEKTKINVDHFYRYRRRLTLNITTGNLEIKNLTIADDMEYTVDISNNVKKIQLTVTQPLRDPEIQSMTSRQKDNCWMTLRCSSLDDGVTLSWDINPQMDNVSSQMSNANYLVAFPKSTPTAVNFTCISRKNVDTVKSSVSLKCEDEHTPVTPPKPTSGPCPDPGHKGNTHSRSRVLLLAPVFFVGVLLISLICIVYYAKERSPSRE